MDEADGNFDVGVWCGISRNRHTPFSLLLQRLYTSAELQKAHESIKTCVGIWVVEAYISAVTGTVPYMAAMRIK